MFKLYAFAALIAVASAARNPVDVYAQAHNLRNSPNAGDGSYRWGFESTNGIAQQESGVGGQQVQGTAAWYAPNGEPITLSYVADEFGYRAVGSHIPTPPPVPAAILRSLEYIRTHPTQAPHPQPAFQRFVPQRFGQQRFGPQRFGPQRFF